MGRLDGRVSIVTGSAQGIGEAIARAFASEGAVVVVADVNDDRGAAVAKDIGAAARFVHLDVGSESQWEETVATTTRDVGPPSILVNNAGFAEYVPIADLSLDSYMSVIRTNQVGVFLGMRTVLSSMTAAGGGSIINISSIFGLVGTPLLCSYTASKFAVTGMTRVAAAEFAAAGIRVNAIHPGGVITPTAVEMGVLDIAQDYFRKVVPLHRMGEPREVANTAVFLASDESSYTTGSSFMLDGGMLSVAALDMFPS